MEELEPRPLDVGNVDPVAAIDAPATALHLGRLVELQIGAGIGASKVGLLGREITTEDHLNQVVRELVSFATDWAGGTLTSSEPQAESTTASAARPVRDTTKALLRTALRCPTAGRQEEVRLPWRGR